MCFKLYGRVPALFKKNINRIKRSFSGSFTLIELCLIIAIIGILIAAAFPAIRQTVQRASFNQFVENTRFFFEHAKSQAIIRGHSLCILEQNKTLILSEPDSAKILIKLIVPERMQILLEPEKIILLPDGTMSEFYLTISDKNKTCQFFCKEIGTIMVNSCS